MTRFSLVFAVGCLFMAENANAAQTYILLDAVQGAEGRVMMKTSLDGARLPVLKRADSAPLTEEILKLLTTGFASQIPAIDAAAQVGRSPSCGPDLAGPIVYLSNEDGGYARHRFYLMNDLGQAALCEDYYVEMTVDNSSLASGEFEEVLAHEWGHILLRRLLGYVPPTPSRKLHSVRTITDSITAFDEGFAVHFQPTSARFTATPGYRSRASGTLEPTLTDLWFSRRESWARRTLVPQNLFAFEKHTNAYMNDPYKQWLENELSVDVNTCELKTGAQMVASEGVVAAFFYKLLAVESEQLQSRYKQLIDVVRSMGGWPTRQPAIVAFVLAWGDKFPDERGEVTKLFLDITGGATASDEVRMLSEEAACHASRGELESFLRSRTRVEEAQNRLLAEVLAGERSLDAAVGPELWIANPEQKVAAAPWQESRSLPVVTDLNTASRAELALAFSGTSLAGSEQQIVNARKSQAFADIDDVVRRAGLGSSDRKSLVSAALAFVQLGLAKRF